MIFLFVILLWFKTLNDSEHQNSNLVEKLLYFELKKLNLNGDQKVMNKNAQKI